MKMRPQTHDLGSLLPVAIRVLLVLLALATLVQVAGLGAEKGVEGLTQAIDGGSGGHRGAKLSG